MISEGTKLIGESGNTYLAVSPLGQSNVWTAVQQKPNSNTPSQVVVIKEPGEVDTQPGWPSFQNEMIMHEVFKDSPAIRQQLDRIPPTKPSDPPMIVLEITETTLWGARTKRPMTLAEIKKVAKDVLIGLRDVHAQGLVYADLKPQNIMVDGFNADSEAKDTKLSAKLGDLGIVTEPMNGTVQPITYRAPEVYFKGDITSRIDVWGWALIYCHMLEARNCFEETGLYDGLETKNGSMAERTEAVGSALANDYKLQNDPVYSGYALAENDPSKHKGEQWEFLRKRGLEDGEVDFLRWVLRADPYQRPDVNQILESGWLDKTDDEVALGFTPPEFESLEYDPQRATPAEVSAQDKLEAANNNTANTLKSNRPAMHEKRLRSAEDDIPVKKIITPESFDSTTTAQQVPVTSQPSTITSNPEPVHFQPIPAQTQQKPVQSQPEPVQAQHKPVQFQPVQPSQFVATQPEPTTTTQNAPPLKSFDSVPTLPPIFKASETSEVPSPFVGTTTFDQAVQERPKISTRNTGTFLSYQ